MTSLLLAAAIGISAVDPHYFADDKGRTWIPVGCNICFDRNANPSPKARELYDGWMTKFAANGGNFMRLWLSTPFLDVMPDKAYEFSEEATDNLKWLVARAEALGIKLKFTFENFRRLGPKTDASPEKGVVSFKNTAYAPYAKTMRDVFTSPKCFDIYLAKARHVAEAVGKSDALIAVELWNEITSVDNSELGFLGEWSEKMLAELKKLYPGKMTLQNLGSFSGPGAFRAYDWMAGLKGNDFMQAHRYFDPGAELDICFGPMDVLCADAVRELRDRRMDCPAILAETGAVERNHKIYSHRYQLDKAGMLLHDEIFAPFFAGSAGCGQPWHWDHQYISQHDLWYHFKRFAKAVEGLDPAAEHFRPFRTATHRLRFWGLRGDRTTIVWLRDKRNTWATEIETGRPPEVVTGEKLPKFFLREKLDWYLPWEDRSLSTDSLDIPPFLRSAVVRFATTAQAGACYLGPPDAEHAHAARRHEGIPSLACDPDTGRLWAVWYGGITPCEDSNNYLMIATSENAGDTWKEVLVYDPDGMGPVRAFDPEMWVSPDGKLQITWTERTVPVAGLPTGKKMDFGHLGGHDDHSLASNDRLMMLTLDVSKAPCAPYPAPRQIGTGVMMCKPIVGPNGEWMFPVSIWWTRESAGLLVSEDGGRTFTRRGGATIVPDQGQTFDEHSIVLMKDGSIHSWIRTDKGAMESFSSDGGRTWSPVVAGTFANTPTRRAVARLKSGGLLLIKNGDKPDADQGRRNLTAYISDDEGKTWKGGLLLDPRPSATYPDFAIGADGTIYAVWDYNRCGDREVLFGRFTEGDVRAGHIVSPRSRLGVKVTSADKSALP